MSEANPWLENSLSMRNLGSVFLDLNKTILSVPKLNSKNVNNQSVNLPLFKDWTLKWSEAMTGSQSKEKKSSEADSRQTLSGPIHLMVAKLFVGYSCRHKTLTKTKR